MTGRLIVLGAGAIGAGIGGLLHTTGTPVVLVARAAHGAAMAADGLDLRAPAGATRVRLPVVGALQPLAPTPDDLVLVCVMGHHTADAVAGLDPAVPVVSLQNGTAPLDVLASRGHAVTAGMVFVPAERRAPGVVVLSGDPVPGALLLGGWPSGGTAAARWLAPRLRDAGFRAEALDDIAPWVHAKALANLGGIVVALCDDPPVDVIEAARAEALAVHAAAGRTLPSVEALVERVGPLAVVPVDGQPRVGGSTRHALRRGDALETAALHGPVLEEGARLGVPTPVNAALVRLAEQARGTPAGGWSADALRAAVGLG